MNIRVRLTISGLTVALLLCLSCSMRAVPQMWLDADKAVNLAGHGTKKSLRDNKGRTAWDICLASGAPPHIIDKVRP